MVIYGCPGFADGRAAVSVLKAVIAQNVHRNTKHALIIVFPLIHLRLSSS